MPRDEDNPPLSAESRLPDISDTEPAPPPDTERDVTAKILAELLTAVTAMPGIIQRTVASCLEVEREHTKRELTALGSLLSASIDGTREELAERMNAGFAALDRKLDKRADATDGKLDALAERVENLAHVTAETTKLAYKFAKEEAGEHDHETERFTAAEAGQ